jgi:hypothetical protein
MTMIALFGFLNRWNDTLATDPETPLEYASAVIGHAGWEPAKHAHAPAQT